MWANDSDLPRTTFEQMRDEVQRKVKIGQPIRIRENLQEIEPPVVRVHKFYPHYVLCIGKGYHTCYSYHDLWIRLRPRQNITVPNCIKGVVA